MKEQNLVLTETQPQRSQPKDKDLTETEPPRRGPQPGKTVTQTSDVFVKKVVFLTVNHRGPLPFRELHSTDETIVWRDLGNLEPVSQWFNHLVTGWHPSNHSEKKVAIQNVIKNKTIQKKSWVEESVKQHRKRSTQHKYRYHAKNQTKQYHYEEDLVKQKAPGPRQKQWEPALQSAYNNRTRKKKA